MYEDDFEWDPVKAESNIRKHGVGFEEARLVFDDVFAAYSLDPGAAYGEDRFVITGMVEGVLLTVIYTERGARTRIISARKAMRHEQGEYYRRQTSG